MFKINLQSLLLAWNILYVCSFSTTDVCDTNDENCVHPNVFKPGAIVIDKFLGNSVLLRLQEISLLVCIKSCIGTSMCTSVSYRKNLHVCDINGASNDVISDEKGCVYTQKSSWSNRMGGKCAEHNCKKGTTCIGKHKNGTYHCKLAYCIGDPHVSDAMLVEKFGMYRNVGHAVKYNCKNGLKMTRRPFVVCQTTGNWKTLFVCGPKGDFTFSEAQNTWYKFFSCACFGVDAIRICKNHNAQVIYINSLARQQFLETVLHGKRGFYFIDGNDYDGDNVFAHSNGALMTYFNFRKGEPSRGRNGENCLAAAAQDNFKWHDIECGRAIQLSGVVCEIPP